MIWLPRLYAIADASFGNPVQLARSVFDGGARLVQIRNKSAGAGELFDQVKQIVSFAPSDAIVLVNDRVDVALLAGAHGVHLGQDDLPVVHARQILGTHGAIGFSTHTLEQALRADLLAVDYIAVGPVFPTQTKTDASAVVGLEQLEQICRRIRKPVVAIGGITLERVSDVLAAGARSAAVISALLRADDITAETRRWINYAGSV
jgi:thiamine-phosphate pyrophosphorylase